MRIRFTDIIKESKILTEGRKEDAKAKYPLMPDKVFETIIEKDPSGNHKYLPWIAKIWYSEKCERYIQRGSSEYYMRTYCENQDTLSKFMDDISYFHEKPSKFTQKDINEFDTINSFTSEVRDARLKLTKGELKKQANKLYETDRYLVIEPNSHASSCYYGAGTQWCTTMKNQSTYFDQYYKHSSLLYFINKKTGKKRAFLTRLGTPMFGPRGYGNKDWAHAGDKEYKNYSGTIYTETDNQGRSFRGIPVDARVAMQKAHKEKTKKWVGDMSVGREKVDLMTRLGMDNIPEIVTVDSWDTHDGPIPSTVTNVTGDLILRGDSSLGNVKKVGGRLNILRDGNLTITELETVNSIRIQSGNINLGSLTGTIKELTLEGTGRLVNAGDITKIDALYLRNMNITKVLLNSIDIGSVHFTHTTAQIALGKVFKNFEVIVSRW